MSNVKKKWPQIGQRYQIAGRRDVLIACLLEVKSHDEFGRPKEVVAHYDEDKVDVQAGMEFWVVYSPEHMVKPRVKGDA